MTAPATGPWVEQRDDSWRRKKVLCKSITAIHILLKPFQVCLRNPENCKYDGEPSLSEHCPWCARHWPLYLVSTNPLISFNPDCIWQRLLNTALTVTEGLHTWENWFGLQLTTHSCSIQAQAPTSSTSCPYWKERRPWSGRPIVSSVNWSFGGWPIPLSHRTEGQGGKATAHAIRKLQE